MQRQVFPIGPFTKGVIDSASTALNLVGAAPTLREFYMEGIGRLKVRPGTSLAMTLLDDAGSPAAVTSVVALVPFGDGALAVGHSTVTSKYYLYKLSSDLSSWFDAAGSETIDTNAEPTVVLWTSASALENVFVAEGLGIAYIAHANAGTAFPTKTFEEPGTVASLSEDLAGTGAADVYFRGVVSFNQHLWGWGHNYGVLTENDRPELLRFGGIYFTAFASTDSFAVGHRVRSDREQIVACVVAGMVMYVGLDYAIWPVHGFDRNSWDKQRPLDNSYGFAGPKCAVEARGVLYYWSHRGPMRVSGLNQPESLWDAVASALPTISDPSNVIAVFDADRDQVIWVYSDGTNSDRLSKICAYDVNRNAFLGPDGDLSVGMFAAALVQPVSLDGPTGPPTNASTSAVDNISGTANWTNADTTPGVETFIEYKLESSDTWIEFGSVVAGVALLKITGLTTGLDYEWRAYHKRNNQVSTYLGPVAGSQFTTTSGALTAPSNLAVVCFPYGGKTYARLTWTIGDPTAETHIYWEKTSSPGSSPLPNESYALAGDADYDLLITDASSTEYFFQCRHEKAGETDSAWNNDPADVSETFIRGGVCI